MTELRDSTDESDLREDRDHPGSGLFRSSILTYLGAGFAGLLGSLVSVMLTIGYLFYNLNDQSPVVELVIITGACLTTSLIAGPILGVIGGGIGSFIAKNAKNASIRTAGWLIGGFIAGLLYVPITLLLFVLANQSYQNTSG